MKEARQKSLWKGGLLGLSLLGGNGISPLGPSELLLQNCALEDGLGGASVLWLPPWAALRIVTAPGTPKLCTKVDRVGSFPVL